jgi:hypothetical protein
MSTVFASAFFGESTTVDVKTMAIAMTNDRIAFSFLEFLILIPPYFLKIFIDILKK